jgi:hypothetical protein
MEIVGSIIAVAVIALLLVTLGAIIRFSFISPRRTKGARQRLRRPDIRGLEALCGFSPPSELVAFYKEAPFVELTEFTLIDRSQTPAKEWIIGTFHPLTLIDVKEGIASSGVPGIPIAIDIEKGTYFVDKAGSVKLSSPNTKERETLIAPNIGEFAKFEVRQDTGDEE